MRMKKKAAGRGVLIWLAGLFLMILPGEPSAGPGGNLIAGPVAAEVVKVVDGDTLTVRARIWIDLEMTVNIRIRGIDAPELRGQCAREKMLAMAATKRLRVLAGSGVVNLSNVGEDKYFGRAVADVTTSEGGTIAALMLESGLVRPYESGARSGWCDASRFNG
jgi:micrococcal nuclease